MEDYKEIKSAHASGQKASNGVKAVQGDAAKGLPVCPEQGFDLLLVDAPCSGLGVLRRNPDAKWKEPNIKDL